VTCTQCAGIERQFDGAVARRELKRYRRRGPSKTTRWLLDAMTSDGVRGRTFLDIGGGVGAISHDLMSRGAAGGTHADASSAFIDVARSEAETRGYADRIRYLEGDFVALAAGVAPAELVTLDRVVCCYPDAAALIDASASRATNALGLVLPRDTRLTRLGVKLVNLLQRIRRHPFRVFLHSPGEVAARVEGHGLQWRFRRYSLLWQVLVFTRPTSARAAVD
jgi:magnesium-protoporphyrin O-methyltransferase